MALEWVKVWLRGWSAEKTTGQEFFDALGLKAGDGFETEAAPYQGRSALVRLADVEREPGRTCAVQLVEALRKAALWLRGRPGGVFENLRAQGMSLDVFVDACLEGDQLEMSLPAEFLLACGQAGLNITFATNQ